MDAQEIISYIASAEKKTPVKAYIKPKVGAQLSLSGAEHIFGSNDLVVFGDWNILGPELAQQAEAIDDLVVECDRRNSAVPLLDVRNLHARIEPGAIIREHVEIGNNAVIMMGAIINIGARIGENTMIDMGVVLGGRATVGKNCHIGAGAVLAGVIEPASATPVIVEDNVMVGANAVLLEGVHVGEGAVVAAGAVVVEDVAAHAVVAGVPARVVKTRDATTDSKTGLVEALRSL